MTIAEAGSTVVSGAEDEGQCRAQDRREQCGESDAGDDADEQDHGGLAEGIADEHAVGRPEGLEDRHVRLDAACSTR